MEIKKFETEINGTKLIVETGRIANQAGASVTVQMGETVVLATATMSQNPRPGMDFFPLMVDYEERYSAAGKIKGPKFLKREGRPSTDGSRPRRWVWRRDDAWGPTRVTTPSSRDRSVTWANRGGRDFLNCWKAPSNPACGRSRRRPPGRDRRILRSVIIRAFGVRRVL